MNTRSSLQTWERIFPYLILVTTPWVISTTTYDSYLLPKIVWLTCWTGLWWITIVWQPIRRGEFHTLMNKPLGGWLVVALLSTLIHYRSFLQGEAFLHLGLFTALFYAFVRYWRRGGSPVRVVWAILSSAMVVALYGLIQDYGVDFAQVSGGVRDWRSKVIATLGNPNFLAGYLEICMPCIVAYGLRKETRLGGFLASCLCILLIAACHCVTFSVGAMTGVAGALVATLAGMFLFRKPVRLPIVRTLILILTATFAIGWYMLDNPYNSHGRSLYKQAWESPQWWSGMGARQFIWKTTRLMIEDKPCTGIGFGNYLTVHETYQGKTYQRLWHAHDRDYVIPVDQPHFQLLETAAETGPLGVLMLCWLGAAWLLAAGRSIQRTPHSWFAWGAYAGVWVAIVHSFSSFPFHLPASSLMVVVLASYHAAGSPERIAAESELSSWKKGIVLVVAGILGVGAFLQYQGNQYLRSGFEGEGLSAISDLENARHLDPWDHQIHYLLGVQYTQAKWYDNAIHSFEHALRLQEDILAHQWLAKIAEARGDHAARLHELEQILALNPVYPGHYRNLIRVLGDSNPQRVQELTAKAEQLEQQLKQNP